jgi:DNA-binding CsgD family transcriptional regulator
MLPVEPFDLLVSAIYDAALQPELWPDALQAVADSLGCDMFHAYVWDRVEGRPTLAWASAGATAQMHDGYNRHFGAIDPRRRISDAQAPGYVFRCHDHIDAREVSGSEFYQDFLLPHGLRYLMGSTLTRSERHETKLALLRAPGRQPFSDDEVRWGRRLVPHLCRATELLIRQQHWDDVRSADEQALDLLEVGIALLDAGGAVCHLNAAARSLCNGGGLHIAGRRLSAPLGRDARALEDAWRRLAAGGLPQDVLVRSPSAPGGRGMLVVTLCRLPPGGPLSRAAGASHMACIAPLARARLPAANQLVTLFGLTRAEARLAHTLAAGRTLSEAAAEAGVKAATVRSQLLAVLAKTGAKRQQELVTMLTRLPAR